MSEKTLFASKNVMYINIISKYAHLIGEPIINIQSALTLLLQVCERIKAQNKKIGISKVSLFIFNMYMGNDTIVEIDFANQRQVTYIQCLAEVYIPYQQTNH